ncbi:hypothetical protein OSTOST_15472, partial [Ostertagia ostertagi]
MKASIDKRIVYNNCIHYLDIYINDLIVVQEEVFNVLKEEFKPENVCEPTSSPKYLTVMSKFCSSSASRGDMYKNVIYYKALLCLRHTIHLEPKSLVPRILALRWSAYVVVGEWEMVEMALAFEKMKHQEALVDDALSMTQFC